jgi:hypothetical protein
MRDPASPVPASEEQIPEVYARQPLLRQLVPRLVGLERDHHRRRRHHAFAEDLPVVLLGGRHGTGKSAMLDDLQHAYAPDAGPWPGPRVPFARINCTELAERAGVGPEISNNSHMVEVLVELITQLSRPVAGFGRICFPRTTAGLLAVVSARRPGNDDELRVTDRHVAALMGPAPDAGPPPTWDTLFRAALPAPADGVVDPAEFPEAAVRTYLGRQYRWRSRRLGSRHLARWYENYRNEADNRLRGMPPGAAAEPPPVPAAERARVVARLCQEFHQGRGFRRGVERMLMAAFLTDMRYGPFRRGNRTPRPLVLLDNVHTDPGRDFLELLLEHRAWQNRGARDQLVVIATELRGDSAAGQGDGPGEEGGDDLYPAAASRSLHEAGRLSRWTRGGTDPSAGVLLLPLPPLETEHLERMLRRDDRASFDPYIATAVHDLTRGHPMGARRLCDAVVHRALTEEWVAAEELLDLTHPGGAGESVIWRLLDTLVGSENHDELCLFSLAWDREAAEQLAERWVPRRPTEPPPSWSGSAGRGDRAVGRSSRTGSCAPCSCTRCAAGGAAAEWTGPAPTRCSPSTTGGGRRAARGRPRATNGPASCGTGWPPERPRRSSACCTRTSSGTTATRSTGCTPCARWPTRPARRETSGSSSARRSARAAATGFSSRRTRRWAWRSRPSTDCCTPSGTRRTNCPRRTAPWPTGSARTCPSSRPST